MIYGWWIVIAILINISLLGPAAVALANIFQTSVAIEFAISNSAFAIDNVIVLGIGIFVSSIVSHFNKTYLMGIISSIIGLVGYSISQKIYMSKSFHYLLAKVKPLLTDSLFPTKEYSNAYGYGQSAQQLGMVIVSSAVAGTVDVSGVYNTAWIVMAILGVVGGASWLVAITNSKNYVK